MPPKAKKEDLSAQQAAPPPPPPDPRLVAARQVVERWEKRVSELQENLAKTATAVGELEDQRTQREQGIKELFTAVQDTARPLKKEPEQQSLPTPRQGAGKKGKKEEAPPPPAPDPPLDEEEQKKVQKTTNVLMNVFKKKKDKINVVLDENGNPTDELSVTKPPEIQEDMWQKVLRLRDEKIQHEDQLLTMRNNMDSLTARRQNLDSMEKVIKYALDAANFELEKAQAQAAAAAAAAAGGVGADLTGVDSSANLGSPGANAASPSANAKAQGATAAAAGGTNRPPSQVVKHR